WWRPGCDCATTRRSGRWCSPGTGGLSAPVWTTRTSGEWQTGPTAPRTASAPARNRSARPKPAGSKQVSCGRRSRSRSSPRCTDTLSAVACSWRSERTSGWWPRTLSWRSWRSNGDWPPDMAGTQLLPELVGRDVAKELTLTGRIISGEQAAALGLATRTEEEPLAAACELAASIAARDPDAVRWSKKLLDKAGRPGLAAGDRTIVVSDRAEH